MFLEDWLNRVLNNGQQYGGFYALFMTTPGRHINLG